MEGFNSMVEHAWLSFSHSDSNAMVRFKKKLQDLNSIIRLWVKDKKFHLHNAKNSLQNVWNCGENKSPGPDGYTFEFFRKYWSLIGVDFCDAVDYFFKS
ncbi:hypothetical protein Tco_0935115, partial [Tanacetum coccineum]